MTGLDIALTALALFVGMLFLTQVGRWIGRTSIQNRADDSGQAFAVLEGGVFGLMGLLIALTFSQSASRLESRRQVIVDEANAIGTAWLRIALLPEAKQGAMRQQFRQYVDIRLAFLRDTADSTKARSHLDRTNTLQSQMWSEAVVASRETPTIVAATLLLPALNSMIDLTSTGTMLAKTHIPWLIRLLLVISPLICAFLAGIQSVHRAEQVWMPAMLFALLLSLTTYVVLDLDYPRVGIIRIDGFDEALVELRASMGHGE